MLDDLTESEKDVVRRALLAAADGPFFPDWEFQTLFGLERREVRDAASAWPNLSAAAHFLAVSNALNNLTGYPIAQEERLADFSLDRKEMAALLGRIRSAMGKPSATFSDRLE